MNKSTWGVAQFKNQAMPPSSSKILTENGASNTCFSARQTQILRHALILTLACSLYYLKLLLCNPDNQAKEAQQQSSNNNNVIHALSGSLGSAISITIFYPLETVRTRLQVGDLNVAPTSWSPSLVYKIYEQEGLLRLYRGWWSLLAALMSLNFCYFYCFHSLRLWLLSFQNDDTLLLHKLSEHKMILDLVAGYLSGCVAVIVTGPLWLVNTRLKLQGVVVTEAKSSDDKTKEGGNNNDKNQYDGMIHCLYTIYKEEGLLTLWKGTFTSIILSLNPAIQLAAYEMLKRHHLIVRNGSRVLWTIIDYARDNRSGATQAANTNDGSALEHFINALLSKFIATLVTYPIQLIQTRQRWSKTSNNTQQKQSDNSVMNNRKRWFGVGTIQDLMDIIQEQGFLGLYRGLESKLMQTCLNSALMFVAYEKLIEFLTKLLSHGHDS